MSIKSQTAERLSLGNPIPWIIAWLVLLIITYFDAFSSMVNIWMSSNTFNHCFLVIPVALYFLWEYRQQYLTLSPQTSVIAALAGFVFACVDLLGQAADINALQHIAITGMLVSGVITFVGIRVGLKIWFPLSLFIFMPPLGEELIPWFQNVTTELSVAMLKLTGVPVFRNGLYIDIPAGQFQVAEACSGIHFFFACVFVGYLFACVMIKSVVRRILFVGFSIVLPIIANGIRVYGTIMVGEYVGMKYARGVDHVVYGWFFFLLVMIVLILAGRLFSDQPFLPEAKDAVQVESSWYGKRWFFAFLLVLIPVLMGTVSRLGLLVSGGHASIHLEESFWRDAIMVEPVASGLPVLKNEAGQKTVVWSRDGRRYSLFLAWYDNNKPGSELIMWANRPYDVKKWSLESSRVVNVGKNQSLMVNCNVLVSDSGERRMLLYWYKVHGLQSYSKIKVKLWQALNSLGGRSGGGAMFAISTAISDDDVKSLLARVRQLGLPETMSNTLDIN